MTKTLEKIPVNAWLAVGALAVGLYLFKRNAGAMLNAVNPTSDSNLAYKGVNAVGDQLDDGQDNDSFSLGSWLYDMTHPYDGFDYADNNPLKNVTFPRGI